MGSGTDSSLDTCKKCGKWLDGVGPLDSHCRCPNLVRQIEANLCKRINRARAQGHVHHAVSTERSNYDCFLEVYLPKAIADKITENNAQAVEDAIWEFDEKLRNIVGDKDA